MRKIAALLPAFVLSLLVGTLAAFPGAARAAASGDLIKLADDGNPDTTADSAVYFYGGDGKRYVFPNSQTYFTWYKDFASVKTVTPAELSALPIGGNVTYRPGTRLVKITSDPNVYAVEPGGTLRWIQTEAVAKSLFGDNWAKRVDDVPDAFFFNYVTGQPLAAAVYPDGTVVKRTGDGAYFRIENRNKRRIVSVDVLASLRVQDAYVLTTAADLADYPSGTDITTAEASITDTSQKTAAAMPSVPTFTVRSPPTNYVAIGAEGTFLELHLATAKAVTIQKLVVNLDATTNNPKDSTLDDDKGGLVYGNNSQLNLTSVRIVDAQGAEPFGRLTAALDVEKDQSQAFVFTGSLAVPANVDKVLYVRADVSGLLPVGEGFRATLIPSSSKLVDSASGATISFLPTDGLAGPTLTSLNATLEVAVTSSTTAKTYVRGAKNAELGNFSFKATTVAPNVIKALTLQGYVDEEGVAGFLPGTDVDNGTATRVNDMVPQVSLYASNGDLVAGPVAIGADGRAVFTGMNFAIAAGQTAALAIRGDLSPTVDLETAPNRIAFDVKNALGDVSVVDDHGTKVNASGDFPNGGTNAGVYATVKTNGTISWSFTGVGTPAFAGSEVLLGTLTADVKDDDFALKTVSFRQDGTPAKSMVDLRLEYPTGVGAATASVTKPFSGALVSFTGIDVPLARDKKTDVRVYAKVLPRDGGALYGENLKVQFGTADPLQFVSKTNGMTFSESNLFSGDFPVPTNARSGSTVRFSALSVGMGSGPSGAVYRDSAVEVMKFNLSAAASGPVRVKKLTFKLAPADAGKAGAQNDALERWATVNGDFEDDDAIANLKQVVGTTKTVIGEESSAHIRYSLVKGGLRNPSPSTALSAAGDYGVLEYDFEGNELFIGAGGTLSFSFEVDISKLDTANDYALEAGLLGGLDMEWTDITSGAYTPLTGIDASFTGGSNSVTVKK